MDDLEEAGFEVTGQSTEVAVARQTSHETLELPHPRPNWRRRVVAIAGAVLSLTTMALHDTDESAAAETGGYEWSGAKDYKPSEYEWWIDENNDGKTQSTEELLDPNGYYYRNCTSFVADWLSKHGYTGNVTGFGSAHKWNDKAMERKIPVDTAPKVGDVAVFEGGTWGDFGHVAIVEAVDTKNTAQTTDDTVTVIEYNIPGGSGSFNRKTGRKASAYIHFPGVSSGNTPVQDSDNDGVLDPNDHCPTTPGSPSNNGCPLPPPNAITRIVPGDWDGNRTDTPGLTWRHDSVLNWMLSNANDPAPAQDNFNWGWNDQNGREVFPLSGNWDGIGGESPGFAYRHDSVLTWYLTNYNSSGPAQLIFNWGWNDWNGREVAPVVGDWDGNGTDTPGFAYRHDSALTWYLTNSPDGQGPVTAFDWGWNDGNGTEVFPVAGNWDGMGGDTPGFAYRHNSALTWYLTNFLDTRPAQLVFDWGWNDGNGVNIIPIAGNWDGMGGDTPGFGWRDNGTISWYLTNFLDTRPAQIQFPWGFN